MNATFETSPHPAPRRAAHVAGHPDRFPGRRPVHAVGLTAVALALGACATLGGANYVSLDEEWAMGQDLEVELSRQLDLVDDGTLENYLNSMGQAMVRRTELGNRPWRFHVVRDGEINAFNVPGGMVYVNTGLMAQAGTAAEFAGALAHEIGHGVARHGTQRLSQMQEANVIAGVLLGNDPGTLAQIGAQVAAAGTFASFSREDEREADQLAVQMMTAAGYDPEGLARLLERILAQGGSGGGFFSSHPNPEERIQNVRALAAKVNRSGLRMNDNQFAAVSRRAEGFR